MTALPTSRRAVLLIHSGARAYSMDKEVSHGRRHLARIALRSQNETTHAANRAVDTTKEVINGSAVAHDRVAVNSAAGWTAGSTRRRSMKERAANGLPTNNEEA